MDENTNNAVGLDDAELEAAWEEEDVGTEAAGGARPTLENQQGEVQQPENPPAAPENKTDPAGGQNQPEIKPEDQPELFTIKYNGKDEQVTREQLFTLAQKGRNYDHVQQELDQLRQYKQEADPALEFVKNYAAENKMSVPDYMDWCRTRQLVRGGMSEQDAKTKIDMEKKQAELDAQEARINADKLQRDSLLKQTQARQEARQKDMNAFLKAYPDVKADSIPKEVWAAVAQGDSLVNAYTMHENKRLAAELAAERQNKANREKSPGSLGGNSGAELDEIDRIWAEDE